MRIMLTSYLSFILSVTTLLQTATTLTGGCDDNGDWLLALPFTRLLKYEDPPMNGKDVVILQSLLRRHPAITSLRVNGIFDKSTIEAIMTFQTSERLSRQDGILHCDTGMKVIETLMHDGYRDDESFPADCKFKLHVQFHRDRTIETNATLYKCGQGDIGPVVLHTFKIRGRGGTKKGHRLNQLTSNGDTPTGLSKIDLNSAFPGDKLKRMFGLYPILRIVKGIHGNVAIGRENTVGKDGMETFLNDYRFGILVHTGIWKDWDESLPMPDSLGCMKTHPRDQKRITDLLVSEAGVIVNRNTYGKIVPYPYKPQGYISVEEIG